VLVTATRICRVAVDVLAVERLFDYTVPEALAGAVGLGTIVRVNLGGRRVRGWVVEDDVVSEAPPEKLRPLLAAVSAGPSPEIVDLTAWAAWRFAGPRLPLLRAASPAAVVPAGHTPDDGAGSPPNLRSSGTGGVPQERRSSSSAAELAVDAAGRLVATVRWPPAAEVGEIVAGLLAESGSTIVVVPDGRLGRLAAALRATGATVVPWLTEGRPRDRARAWDRTRRGGCVLLGGRSAVLAPVPDLAAVVVVDDGSEALKEERSPTWHARDLAAERARRRRARVTLVSPAPPLEAPGPVLVPSRTDERAGWPITEVIDRRREPPGLGLFSERTVAALRAAADPLNVGPERVAYRNGRETAQASGSPVDETVRGRDVRAVCVLNRRGRARLLACAACSELARCERCEASVAEVDAGTAGPEPVAMLGCAVCGATRPRVCVRCGSMRLKVLRSGVTRVREDLAVLLPGVGVAMVDAATGDLPGEPVLIGTEAVLHRVEPHPGGSTSVVVFLDFDAELLAPRLRAGEQALWLLVRAARLVGPRSAGGRLLVQTRLPRHEVIEAAVRADPGLLAETERPRRKLLDLPPYAALARLTGDAPALAAASAALRVGGNIGVSGGADGVVLVRAANAERLADALAAALAAGRPAGRLRAEVDPLRV
jgi:primosomal protein N' (replication factor Y) (superfamily II helicase)